MIGISRIMGTCLYQLVDETYFKEGDGNEPFTVSTCPSENRPCKELSWDPFSNSPSHATAYTIGSTRSEGDQTAIDITVDLHRADSGYVITDLRYAEPHYYYTGAIVALVRFLQAYNC